MSTTMMARAAVDAEFREMLERSGVSTTAMPAQVEALDLTGLDAWTAATIGRDVYACRSTCSFGPITAVCDGTSK